MDLGFAVSRVNNTEEVSQSRAGLCRFCACLCSCGCCVVELARPCPTDASSDKRLRFVEVACVPDGEEVTREGYEDVG